MRAREPERQGLPIAADCRTIHRVLGILSRVDIEDGLCRAWHDGRVRELRLEVGRENLATLGHGVECVRIRKVDQAWEVELGRLPSLVEQYFVLPGPERHL